MPIGKTGRNKEQRRHHPTEGSGEHCGDFRPATPRIKPCLLLAELSGSSGQHLVDGAVIRDGFIKVQRIMAEPLLVCRPTRLTVDLATSQLTSPCRSGFSFHWVTSQEAKGERPRGTSWSRVGLRRWPLVTLLVRRGCRSRSSLGLGWEVSGKLLLTLASEKGRTENGPKLNRNSDCLDHSSGAIEPALEIPLSLAFRKRKSAQ